MGEHTAIVAICNTHAEAEAATRELTHAGFHIKTLSVVGQDYRSAKHVGGYSSTVNCIKYGSMDILGIGPVLIAGPLLGWVLGALEETVVAGGITAIGTALTNMGIPKGKVLSYETALRFGKFILLGYGTAEEMVHARNIWKRNGLARSLIGTRPRPPSRLGRWSHERGL